MHGWLAGYAGGHMSDDCSKIYQRASYMRDMLIAHVVGRRVNEADYDKLRRYFLALEKTKNRLPKIVVDHPDLSSFWHSMRYTHATHEARRAYVMEQFDSFLSSLTPATERDDLPDGGLPAGLCLTDEKILHKIWRESSCMVESDSQLAVNQMKHLIERLCYQLLQKLKVVPDPRQHDFTSLVTLTETSLQLSAGHRFHASIKRAMSGCQDILEAIGDFISDLPVHEKKTAHMSAEPTRILITLYGSLAFLLLGGWRMREALTASLKAETATG